MNKDLCPWSDRDDSCLKQIMKQHQEPTWNQESVDKSRHKNKVYIQRNIRRVRTDKDENKER